MLLRSDWRAYTNPRTHITKADTVIYRCSQHNCSGCAMKEQCCPNMPFRKIARSVHESARDVARKLSATPEFKQSRRERKKVEMLFAHLKWILKLDRLRLRGFPSAPCAKSNPPTSRHDALWAAPAAGSAKCDRRV